MFEAVKARAEALAEGRARKRKDALAARLEHELPPGIRAEAGTDGVVLTGRRLGLRYLLDPALRHVIGGAG